MYLAIHVPMFGSTTVDSKPIECPHCPKKGEHGANDWVDAGVVPGVTPCNPGDKYTCARCGTVVTINWGLVEPDHLSTWLNSEYCPHRLCRRMVEQLREAGQ